MSLSNLKEKINKIPIEKRILISEILFVFSILFVYLGIFGLIFSNFAQSPTLFSFLYILLPLFFLLYVLFYPNLFEKITYDLKKLGENLGKIDETKIFYRSLIRDLNKIALKRGEGYTKKFYRIFKDYFSNVMFYLIFSKRDNVRELIKESLSKLSNSRDIHDLHDGFIEMNKKIVQLKEFKNLLIAFPPIERKNLHNPFLWISKISNERSLKERGALRRAYIYLEEIGAIKLALKALIILLITTISGLVLSHFGLLDWAKLLIGSIP